MDSFSDGTNWTVEFTPEPFSAPFPVSGSTAATWTEPLASHYDPLPAGTSGSLLHCDVSSGPTITTPAINHQTYVVCSPDVFLRGIKYDTVYLRAKFPILHNSLCEAKILARNCLIIDGPYNRNFDAFCRQKLVETCTIRPVERGIT